MNYFRRFLPAYQNLKELIKNEISDTPKLILVKYNRGFMNYGSHAWDIITYLMRQEISANNIIVHSRENFRDSDSILTLDIESQNTKIRFQPICVDFPVFQIEFFYQNHEINLSEYGNTISVTKYINDSSSSTGKKVETIFLEKNALKNYMKYAMEKQLSLANNGKDNFLESVNMNKIMLSINNKL